MDTPAGEWDFGGRTSFTGRRITLYAFRGDERVTFRFGLPRRGCPPEDGAAPGVSRDTDGIAPRSWTPVATAGVLVALVAAFASPAAAVRVSWTMVGLLAGILLVLFLGPGRRARRLRHGLEHRVILAAEAGLPATPESVAATSPFTWGCGSRLFLVVLPAYLGFPLAGWPGLLLGTGLSLWLNRQAIRNAEAGNVWASVFTRPVVSGEDLPASEAELGAAMLASLYAELGMADGRE